MTCRGARAVALALAVAGSGAALPASAGAHGESSAAIRSVIDRVEPPAPAVEVEVLRGRAAALAATNRGRDDLVVIGDEGEPFLRIGPRGTFANVNSRSWYRSGNPDGVSLPPTGARVGAAPRWKRVSREATWTWFDHRLHPATLTVPAEAAKGRRTVRLDSWKVPMRLAGRPLEVAGHVEYRPLTGAVLPELTSPAMLGAGAFVTILRGRVPGLYVQSTGAEPISVAGREGEPFARIGPRGTQVNLRSPTYVDDQLARGERVQLAADADAPPRWRRVNENASFGWLDSRARYAPEQPPDEVVRRDRPAVLGTWRVPVRVGGRRLEITGRSRWVPTPTTGATRPAASGGEEPGTEWLAGAIAVLVLAGLAVALRLRLRRRDGRVPAG